MRELDVAQGRVLSEELITHYADQGQEGVAGVEKTVRKIEQDFRDGLGENSARVMCFIPSGNVWDIFADPAYRDAFMSAHCVVPSRALIRWLIELRVAQECISNNLAPVRSRSDCSLQYSP